MQKLKTSSLLLLLLNFSLIATAQDNQLSKAELKDGWQLLFDGKTTSGWKGAFINKFPENGWKVANGMLQVEAANGAESSNGGDIVTINEYSDFELKLDFKLTKGANSGVKYFVAAQQPTPATPRSAFGLEYQLLDDQTHPDAKLGKNGNRTIASLYDLIPAIKNKTNLGIGNWNTLKIKALNNHVEHWLNDILVVSYEKNSNTFLKLVAESKYKDIKGFGLNNSGKILLQDHGNEVYFKNIKVKILKNATKNNPKQLLNETPGIVSFTFRKQFEKDFVGTLDYIKSLGIDKIEFSNLFGKTAFQIKQLLDERGMKCTSFGVSYDDINLHLDQVGKNAQTLGASFVRVAWIPHDNTTMTLAIAKKAAIDFNKAGKILKEKFNLTFCYHNHGFDMQKFEGQTYFDLLVKETDPKYVSFELDILWAYHPGLDPVALLKKYGNRFKLMHLKDLKKDVVGDLTGTTPIENDVALGSGQIAIKEVIKAALKSNIQYFYLEDESNDSMTQIPVSLTFLKSL